MLNRDGRRAGRPESRMRGMGRCRADFQIKRKNKCDYNGPSSDPFIKKQKNDWYWKTGKLCLGLMAGFMGWKNALRRNRGFGSRFILEERQSELLQESKKTKKQQET